MSDSTPKPGWYADPEDPASERWWNGSGWSEQQRPSTAFVAPASPTTPPPVAAPPLVPSQGSDSSGFVFGTGAPAGARPDPYAPPAPTQAYYGAPYGARPPSATNGLALAGLLVSSIGWLFAGALAPVVGLILSIVGLSHAATRERQGLPGGRGLAMAGIVVSGIILVIALLFLVVLVASFSTAR